MRTFTTRSRSPKDVLCAASFFLSSLSMINPLYVRCLHAAGGNSKDRLANNSRWLPQRKNSGEWATHRQPNSILVPQRRHSSIQARLRQHTLWITNSSAASRRFTFHQKSLKARHARPVLVGRPPNFRPISQPRLRASGAREGGSRGSVVGSSVHSDRCL